jgi:hypothetical protein
VALIRAQLQARVTLDQHNLDVGFGRQRLGVNQGRMLDQKLVRQNGHEERRHI